MSLEAQLLYSCFIAGAVAMGAVIGACALHDRRPPDGSPLEAGRGFAIGFLLAIALLIWGGVSYAFGA